MKERRPLLAERDRLLFFLMMIAFVASGCASSGNLADRAGIGNEREVERTLRAEVRQWEGAPHRLGGTSRSGLDCSAFVHILYRDLFDTSLPRTTEDQAREGRRVERSRLAAGDLVFFRPSAKTRHVGIYLGRDEFAHVSTSSGVMISSLTEDYWNNRYWMSRRILGAPAEPNPRRVANKPEPRRQPATTTARGTARTGW